MFHDPTMLRQHYCRHEMMNSPKSKYNNRRIRRGSAVVLGLFLTSSLIVLLAISLDFGFIVVSQAEVRRSADAAAMAACWELFEQQNNSPAYATVNGPVRNAATSVAALNSINQTAPSIGSSSNDLAIGNYTFANGGQFSTSLTYGANAVRVRLARQSDLNGEVPLFFGAITSRNSQSLQQYSVAAMINNIKGFYTPATSTETVQILPIALDLGTWQSVVAGSTTDSFCYTQNQVSSGSDGFYECNLYPQGTGSPGNRGTVDIGGQNNSTADLSRQVRDGISRQDFLDLGKPLEFDQNGVLTLNGDTGISAGIKDDLASIVGQKRMIPIYTTVSGNGNNAMYMIVRFEGVRILDVKLTGSMSTKRVTIQPAKMIARYAILSTQGGFTSDYLVSPVMIVE